MKLCPRLPQGWTLKNLTLTKSASQGKTIVYCLPSMQDEKRAAKELTYNTKRDSEHSNRKYPPHRKSEGSGMNKKFRTNIYTGICIFNR